MDEGGSIESTEDHVHFPVDAPKKWGYCEGEDAIPGPIRGGGERDSFSTNLGGKDFGRVGP